MELQIRYEFLTSLLGVNPTARSVFRVLHMDNRGWSISGMSRKVNVARSTVRAIVQRNEKNGTIQIEDDLIYATPTGSDILIQVQRETFRIALGQQEGFSADTISIFRDLAGFKIDARCSTICFQKDLPDFITG